MSTGRKEHYQHESAAVQKALKAGAGENDDEEVDQVEQMASKHHPHLVRLLGYCVHMDARTEQHEQIVVYEFMGGGDLQACMPAYSPDRRSQGWGVRGATRPPLSLQQRVQVLVGVARGLQYLHSFGIVHRDIKPANILLDAHMTAKVADFGLVRMGDESTGDTTRILGTPGYVDPAYSKSRKAAPTNDVYSYGIVMLELFTSQRAILQEGDHNVNIRQWAEPLLAAGDVETLKDPCLDAPPEIILQLTQLALQCTSMPVSSRPHMDQIVVRLSDLYTKLFGYGEGANGESVDSILERIQHPDYSLDEAIAMAGAAGNQGAGVEAARAEARDAVGEMREEMGALKAELAQLKGSAETTGGRGRHVKASGEKSRAEREESSAGKRRKREEPAGKEGNMTGAAAGTEPKELCDRVVALETNGPGAKTWEVSA
ncbi:unnamed protein product [Closterium sp. NIES-64]|nr:unnamed protein product [Closterium sp. NIES-64]